MFVELKCKSNFSFLRGASDAREYIEQADKLKIPAVAITDVNGVYGLPRAFEATKNLPHIKLISGAEFSLQGHPPVTLLARNRQGYGQLCTMLTALHADQAKPSGVLPLSDFATLCGASASRPNDLVALPNLEAHTNLALIHDLFGDSTYLPLCRYLDGHDQARETQARSLAQRFGLRLVATNDVHYHEPGRRRVQDALTCIREGTTLRDAGFKLFGNAERYLKSPLQMRSLFYDLPDAIRATLDIAESCDFSLRELKYTYPAELIPLGFSQQSYLEDLVLQGAHRIYRGMIPAAVDAQIRHELSLIAKMDYANYFLTIHDIVEFARRQSIICQGRGSAANSICCYCLGITAIDPVRMNLLFERFISEDRLEPPDIDVDFEHERREEVIQYIYRRYGRDRAAMVSAVRTYRRKSSFLELSKSIGIAVGVRNAHTLERDFTQIAGRDADKLELIRELSDEIADFPRHLSIHSGGFTLSHEPITRIVPIQPARMENRTIVQWDKNDLDTVGLLKVDVLSLGFLTALHKCCDLIGIDWRDIPPEDAATYDMICRAETDGCFQIESRAQKSMLPRNQPRTFYDLVVQVAIVRPGPGEGQMISPFLSRRELALRGKPYVCPVPALQATLARTYGVPLFQEQVMKLAMIQGGFSAAEADQLRRSLGSWRAAENVGSMNEKLYDRLIKNGTPKDFADELAGYMKGFAHYGFPESHAASFALIAYASAYLKCHHPAEFLCALLNSQPMGFYSIDTLINEAKRNGVKVLPIHPNESQWDAQMAGERTVRMGFCNLRKLREEDVQGDEELQASCRVLLRARQVSPFLDLTDFRARTKISGSVMQLMAMANIFYCFGFDQRHAFWHSVELENFVDKDTPTQLSLLMTEAPAQPQSTTLFKPLSEYEAICAEYHAQGYSLRGNPMVALREDLPQLPQQNSVAVRRLARGSRVHYAGIMTVLQKPPTAKGAAFITLEDGEGSVDTIIRKEIYAKYREVITAKRFLIIKGRVQRAGSAVSVLVEEVDFFEAPLAANRSHAPGESGRGLGKFLQSSSH